MTDRNEPNESEASRRGFVTAAVTLAGATLAADATQAQASAGTVRFLNPSTLPKPPGYTHVVEVTGPVRTIYIAGQLGLYATGKVAGGPGDFRAQAMQAFENLKNALAAVGATFKDVVKLNNYVVEIDKNIGFYREVRDAFIDKASPPPASTTVGVTQLARPGLLFEVEAIAVVAAKG